MRKIIPCFALLLMGCATTAQQRLCVAIDATGVGLTVDARAERALLKAELTAAFDRECGPITDQLKAIECVERVRARQLETHRERYQLIEQMAGLQRAAVEAYARDCGGSK